MKKYLIYITLCGLVLCLFLLNGCKTSYTARVSDEANTKALDEFVSSMQKQELQFRSLSARLNVDLNMSGKNIGSRVEMKLVKDSVLQLSIQPFLGFELFRMELSRDSIKLLDRMNKRYFAENYAGFKGQLPIDFNFYNLQALFLNQLFLPGEKEVEGYLHDYFELERDGLITSLHTQDRMDLHYLFKADNEEKLLSTQISDKDDHYALLWKYADFQFIEGKKLFPRHMEVSLQKEGEVQGGMDIYYSRIQINKELNMDFKIPPKYKRVTLALIMKSLTSSSDANL